MELETYGDREWKRMFMNPRQPVEKSSYYLDTKYIKINPISSIYHVIAIARKSRSMHLAATPCQRSTLIFSTHDENDMTIWHR